MDFSKLAPTVIETMGEAFPELVEQAEIIRKVLESEEKSFEKTLQRGLQLLDGLAEEGQKEISGEDAFLLYGCLWISARPNTARSQRERATRRYTELPKGNGQTARTRTAFAEKGSNYCSPYHQFRK